MITYCQSIRLQTFSLWKADNKTVLFIYKPVLRFWFFVTLQIIEWWEISLWRRAAIRPSITEPVESPNHTEILCLFSKCFKHHVLPHNFLRECMSVLALGCMSLWRSAPSLQDVDFSVLCGFVARVDTRTQRSKCDSWQSSLLCCLTLSSNASSSSTWMGWWVIPWRCTRTGRLWICGAIKRRTRSERSKLLSFDNNTARNRSCWTPTAYDQTVGFPSSLQVYSVFRCCINFQFSSYVHKISWDLLFILHGELRLLLPVKHVWLRKGQGVVSKEVTLPLSWELRRGGSGSQIKPVL